MTGPRRPSPVRLLLGLSGWFALLTTLLPPADPARVAVTGAFLLVCPGAAVLLASPPRIRAATDWPDRLATAAFAVALSLAIATVTAVALFLAHAFTLGRALGALALLTTLLVLLPGGRPTAPGGGRPEPDGPPAARTGDAGRHRRLHPRAVAVAGSGVLLLTAACGGPSAAPGFAVAQPRAEAAGPSGADQPAAPGPWRQVFRDDFNGTALNGADWVTCYDWNRAGCTNAGNHEEQWYQPGQVSLAGGSLVLDAERRDTAGSDGKTYPWTSGMVSTGRDTWTGTPRHTFTYGYFAAAIRLPAAPEGFFPAFWLIPAATRGTPPELDVAEFPGTDGFVDMNVHWRTPSGGDDRVGHRYQPPGGFGGGTRVFAMDWEPDAVTWYVDGVQQFRVSDASLVPNVAMELVLNLAVGYPDSPPSSVDSAQLRADWVSVWQH
ncbi:family 16 glycosylhydrolase [Kitasatospora sp. NPDC088346]|uniref:glycoside hydrolase family 16 protein n=1 Tax=Kitasatospora sp. NPDC088346 TaxID=3364073 RepID=UPI00381226FF